MKIELKDLKFFMLTILLLLCTITTFSQINKVQELKIENKAAVYWLSNLDNSEFYLCWNGLSSELQIHFDKNDWVIGMANEMGNLGDFIGREESYREFTSEIEGLQFLNTVVSMNIQRLILNQFFYIKMIGVDGRFYHFNMTIKEVEVFLKKIKLSYQYNISF